MAGQKWAWVIVVASVAFMVWLRSRDRENADREELRQYLDKRNLKDAYSKLLKKGIENIYQLEQLAEGDPKSLTAEDRDVMKAIEVVHKDKEDRENRITLFGAVWTLFKMVIVMGLIVIAVLVAVVIFLCLRSDLAVQWVDVGNVVGRLVAAVVTTFIVTVVNIFMTAITGNRIRQQPPAQVTQTRNSDRNRTAQRKPDFNLGLYDRIRGRYLDNSKTTVEWNCDEFPEVGRPTVITLHFKCSNGTPYCLQASDKFQSTINHPCTNTVIPHVVEPSVMVGEDSVKVSFSARLSGDYTMDLRIKGYKIGGGLITRTFRPGPVDASKTIFLQQSNTIVMTSGFYHSMQVAPKDGFGNPAIITQEFLTTEIRRGGPSGELINPECVVDLAGANRYELLLKVEEPGHYVGCVKYEGQTIGPPCISIICLSNADTVTVDKYVTKRTFLASYYEAQMLSPTGRSRKVFCYISPKQFQVREYFIGIIPKRSYTCKVCPSTRLIFEEEPGKFTLDDGYQQSLSFYSTQREVLAATYYRFLLKNIGGSEKFQDKRTFFYNEVKKLRTHWNRGEVTLLIARDSVLESAMAATRWFNSSDWYKKFNVEFKGEEGLDWGGVSRELFELLCVQLFDPQYGLFMRFKDDPQALVHPNPTSKRPSNWKLKHYEFAGRVVGKCFYESALGNPLFVKARFTRSFLAQIIGLRIHHKYFESDNPELFTTKVQYIRDNDVSDLDLVFAEEEYDSGGGAPLVVPLIDKGAEIEVTNQNKMQYLNLLAQYQLAKSVKEEVEHFLKGLNDIIPDNLLSMFDENELELLMCGLSTVSYSDLKQNAVVSGSDPTFKKVVSWFWTMIIGFTQEEMAKLLQFVTGCSQLPPGGFQELKPPFKISYTPTHGRLPTAHTCFNQLCLPTYDSYEQFQQSLTLAINEGAEGFGFA